MKTSRWWKCDFQVATPAWDFQFDRQYDLTSDAGKDEFLDEYMAALVNKGVEVIALADHNTGAWIDLVKASAAKHNVHVFPGCEITTASGADGAHLLLIGDIDKTGQDFDRLIHGVLGFSQEHPPYITQGKKRIPASSPRTITQILDALPDGFLAIAPHVHTENGIASKNTARGDIRWKALHHEKLAAVDPGDCTGSLVEGDGFAQRFRRRELSDFPRLRDLAFVATSDAYSFEKFGSRFTWVRMGEVSLEALRQAFIDHESRVLCHWATQLNAYPNRNPNNIRHAWISKLEVAGQLANSRLPIEVALHPNLNVVIGGRGSGKSTVVSAIRALYSSTAGLPDRLREEAETFASTVLGGAQIKGIHRVQESQEEHTAIWTLSSGSVTSTITGSAVTSFPVTVVSQKELFERAAGDKSDPHVSSRNLLALTDGRIGYDAGDIKTIGGFGRRLDDARTAWSNAVRDLVQLEQDLNQLPALRQRIATLRGQAEAFSSPEVKIKLTRFAERDAESKLLGLLSERVEEKARQVDSIAHDLAKPLSGPVPSDPELAKSYEEVVRTLSKVTADLASSLAGAAREARKSLAAVREKTASTAWYADLQAANADMVSHREHLAEQGLSPREFGRIQGELETTLLQAQELEVKMSQLEAARTTAEKHWEVLQGMHQERRQARQALFDDINERSGRLRFHVQPAFDTEPWCSTLRALGNFRADAYLDDVRSLAQWLWQGPDDQKAERIRTWRDALTSGIVQPLAAAAKLRPPFAERLSKFDSVLRMRLASMPPDDVIYMEFLRDGGDPTLNADWQSVTKGSPGQRTAAMLAFVLHHGKEPLILDQPEDDLDSEWISNLVVKELRKSRWVRQLVVITHNANIPVLGDAEQVIALENRDGSLRVRRTFYESGRVVLHTGPVELREVREDIQAIMEGGVAAFIRREQKYNNETKQFRAASL